VLSLGQQVNVRPHVFDPKQDYLCAMVIEVDFLMKKKLVTVVRLNLLCFVIVLLLYMVVMNRYIDNIEFDIDISNRIVKKYRIFRYIAIFKKYRDISEIS